MQVQISGKHVDVGEALRTRISDDLLLSIGKYFERMADHATNICEMVVYLVEGRMIKHTNADHA